MCYQGITDLLTIATLQDYDMAPLKKTSITIAPALEKFLARYNTSSRESNVTASGLIGNMAERYMRLLADGKRSRPKFSEKEMEYLYVMVIHGEVDPDSPVRLAAQLEFWIPQDLEAQDMDEFSSSQVPDTWKDMLKRLNTLSLAQELSLIEEFEAKASKNRDN